MKRRRWGITSEKFLSTDQVSALVTAMTRERDLAIAREKNVQAIRDYYGVRVLLESGLRVFEFCALLNGDFNGLKLAVRHGKGDKPRTVLLTRATGNVLREWLIVKERLGHDLNPAAPLFPSRYGTIYTTRGVQKRVKLIFKSLGFPEHLSVHSLRHTNCSMLLASGKVGLATVRDNLGHHSIAVTNLYAHASTDLSGVELYPAPSAEKADFSEPGSSRGSKNSNNFVKTFLRKVNFKPGGGSE